MLKNFKVTTKLVAILVAPGVHGRSVSRALAMMMSVAASFIGVAGLKARRHNGWL